MSTFRSVQREMLKREYREFAKNWKNERAYQLFVKAQGQELPAGQRELGRRPTFNMWLKWRDSVRRTVPMVPVQSAPDSTVNAREAAEPDLEWNEE